MNTEKAKCDTCKKLLLHARFSSTGIKKYHESVRRNAYNKDVPIKYPTCRTCGVGNRHELQCTLCDQVKELEKFAKAQRKKTDSAKCLDCQQQVSDREARHVDQVEEEEIMETVKNQSVHGSSRYSASVIGSRVSRLGSKSNAFDTETNPSSDNWHAGLEEVPLPTVQNLTLHDYEDRSSSMSTSTQRAIYGINGGWEPSPGSETRHQRISGNSSNVSGFVKATAVRRDPFEKAAEAIEREQRQREAEAEQLTRESSDEDSEAGDDDDPY